MLFSPSAEAEKVYSFHVSARRISPVFFPPDVLTGQGLPRQLHPVSTLPHCGLVSAIALSSPTKDVYTGGIGCVKVWDIRHRGKTPICELKYLPKHCCIKSLKLVPDGRTLVAGGQAPQIPIWDLASPSPRLKGEITSLVLCNALAISPDSKMCFGCLADGNIAVWDLHNQMLIRQFRRHRSAVSCIDISADGTKIWSGGMDNKIRMWDLIQGRQIDYRCVNEYPSSLAYCPTGEWLAVGLANGNVEVMHITKPEKYITSTHKTFRLSTRYASNGKWFVSAGMDHLINVWRSPFSACLLKMRQFAPVASCEVSSDDKYIVLGFDCMKATVYEIIY